tara:strand:- start:100 stop:333 length:234 start_codon:yes stop_codon:yes gene_type:complete
MIKFYLLLVSVLLFSCNRTDNCLDIRDKYTGNGQFYFELNDSGIFSGNTSDEDPNPTAIVSEEEFNQYQIGDKYCRE